MEELATKYDPRAVEDKGVPVGCSTVCFIPNLMRASHIAIVIPPPNVTGIFLHGPQACLTGSIQDILVRRARLRGKKCALGPEPTMQAIATEAKVANMFAQHGIKKK